MQIKIKIDSTTTAEQYEALSIFFSYLGEPLQEVRSCYDVEPESVVDNESIVEPVIEPVAEESKPQRAPRKAKATVVDPVSVEPGPGPAVVVTPEPTAPAAEPVVEPEPDPDPVLAVEDDVTSGKQYSAPEIQQLAAVIAKTKGPAIVKNKIAEFGKTLVAQLDSDQLNELGAFLESQK